MSQSASDRQTRNFGGCGPGSSCPLGSKANQKSKWRRYAAILISDALTLIRRLAPAGSCMSPGLRPASWEKNIYRCIFR